MKNSSLFASLIFAGATLVHCSSSSPTPAPTADSGTLVDAAPSVQDAQDAAIRDGAMPSCGLPSGATPSEPPSCTTSTAGLFTEYTVDPAKNTYYVTLCNMLEAELYKDQATFDRKEVFTTVHVSNNDYVRTPDCASGSVFNTETKATTLVVWIRKK